MTTWRLILKEILHRRLNFALAVLSVLVAVGVAVGFITLLKAYDIRIEDSFLKQRIETQQAGEKWEDDARKDMKAMGFNVLILPKGQNLSDLYADGYASKLMPQSYADRLANSKLITVRHLLPMLEQKLQWPEQKRTIILIGTHGEVPTSYRGTDAPILQPVEKDQMVLGYELWNSLGFKVGDKATLMGHEFTVTKCKTPQGSKDDITAWIPLDQAQTMLDKPGQITGIMALECDCAMANLALVRDEIGKQLPDTQIIETATTALARAETRARAKQAKLDTLARDEKNQLQEQAERWKWAAWIIPLVIAGCAIGICILTMLNVRDRLSEVGIFRALGLSAGKIFMLFIVRAFLIGLIGSALGIAMAVCVALYWNINGVSGSSLLASMSHRMLAVSLLIALLAAPVLTALASWIPATLAARQDPADVLREV